VLAKYPIAQKGTRHSVLLKLTGELSHKFGFELSERIVAQHYELYRDNVTTGLDDHMREFRNAWKSFRENRFIKNSFPARSSHPPFVQSYGACQKQSFSSGFLTVLQKASPANDSLGK